jgi:vitamin K-dependent gamma-carboxylase
MKTQGRFAFLFRRVDNSQLVAFRILFGLILAAEGFGAILTGWVGVAFVEPEFTFKIPGFEWLEPLPGQGMYWIYGLLGVLGLCVMLGLFFRAAISSYLALWCWAYVTQTASYNNHYYLMILVCFLLLLTPANAFASLDAWRRPELKRLDCPRWCILIFIVQIAIVYEYAGIVKLQPDWLAGRPVGIWFGSRADLPLIGSLLQQEWFRWVVVYGGVLFDLFIVPLLLWRRTRFLAFVISVGFHLFNSYTFQIGVFPYMALSFSLFFFPPETIRRLFFRHRPEAPTVAASKVSRRELILMTLLALHFALQVALPLRHWFYPGQVHWTEDGHRMAWHMMSRTKSGWIYFRLRDPESGRVWRVRPRERLSAKQNRKIAARPDMIWQFAQRLARESHAAGIDQVEIHAIGRVSLNGRKPQSLVDPEVDLASRKWSYLGPTEWILPLRDLEDNPDS